MIVRQSTKEEQVIFATSIKALLSKIIDNTEDSTIGSIQRNAALSQLFTLLLSYEDNSKFGDFNRTIKHVEDVITRVKKVNKLLCKET